MTAKILLLAKRVEILSPILVTGNAFVSAHQGGIINIKKLWSILAVCLIMATAISRNLTDLFFTFAAFVIVGYEWRFLHWQGLKDIFSRLKIVTCLIGLWILANILGYFFSTSMGPDQWSEILGLRWVLSFYISTYLGMNMKFNQKVFRYVAGVYSMALLIGILIQYNSEGKIDRLQGIFENPNVAAFVIAIPWAFLVAWESETYFRTRRTDWYLVALSLLMSIMILFTYGRGIWFAVGALFLILSIILRLKRNLVAIFIAAILFGGFYWQNTFGVKDRIRYSFEVGDGSSQGIRLRLWKTNWAIFLDHPVFGVGYLQNYRLEIPYYNKLGFVHYEYGSKRSHAHNQFLQILVGSGVVGCLSYCMLFVGGILFFYRNYKNSLSDEWRTFALGGFSILLVFVGMGIVDSPLMSAFSRNCFLICLGLCLGVVLVKKMKQQ